MTNLILTNIKIALTTTTTTAIRSTYKDVITRLTNNNNTYRQRMTTTLTKHPNATTTPPNIRATFATTSPGTTATVFRARRTLKVLRTATFPSSTALVTYLKQNGRGIGQLKTAMRQTVRVQNRTKDKQGTL